MFEIWLTLRLLRERQSQLLNPVTFLALIGMALGVGTLLVTMSVISGFQSTIQNSVTDVTGHILLIKRGEPLDNLDILLPRLQKVAPDIVSATPFVHVEGMAAHKGKISGVVVQGLQADAEKTLNLRSRVIEGVYDLKTNIGGLPPAIIGKGLRDKLNFKLGDEINIVLPKTSPTAKVTGFVAQLKKFRVAGVVDLGMYDYDSRYILMSSQSAQNLGGIGPFFTGLRIKLQDGMKANRTSLNLSTELGYTYYVRDWMESHRNLLEAIKLEKIVIFIVLLFMTVAACFNISSTLFISVLKRYPDIALLKTMGATHGRIVKFFSLQGMMLGVMGCILGLALGLGMCMVIAKTRLIYVPAEIYHISYLPVEIRWTDITYVMLASLGLCFLSTLGPAWRGGRLNPVEGLKYE